VFTIFSPDDVCVGMTVCGCWCAAVCELECWFKINLSLKPTLFCPLQRGNNIVEIQNDKILGNLATMKRLSCLVSESLSWLKINCSKAQSIRSQLDLFYVFVVEKCQFLVNRNCISAHHFALNRL